MEFAVSFYKGCTRLKSFFGRAGDFLRYEWRDHGNSPVQGMLACLFHALSTFEPALCNPYCNAPYFWKDRAKLVLWFSTWSTCDSLIRSIPDWDTGPRIKRKRYAFGKTNQRFMIIIFFAADLPFVILFFLWLTFSELSRRFLRFYLYSLLLLVLKMILIPLPCLWDKSNFITLNSSLLLPF